MPGINWSLGRTDPNAQARGFSYADQVAKAAGVQAAGPKIAAGDYQGAAAALAQSGDIQGALRLQATQQQQEDAQTKRAQAVYSYIGQAIPVFQAVAQQHASDPDGGAAALGNAFDQLAPEISQLTGHNDQTLAALRQNLVTDPHGTLARIQAMVPAKYQSVGRTLLKVQGDNVTPVYEGQKDAPPGYQYGPDGKSFTFIPGGPADPSVVKNLATERREVIINNPLPAESGNYGTVELGKADPSAPNITGQTGLSMNGFNYLVGNMAAMGRDKVTRARAAQEAGEFAKRSGTDVATIKSQYTALNNVLQNNLQRANQMEILEKEVQGTVDNLAPVADKISPSNVRWTRQGIQFVGALQNDPNVQQYATYLNQLRADLAGFNAVSGGKMTENGNARTDESDFRAAEKIISSGLNSGGARGLAAAINATGQKNKAIVEDAIDNTTRRVWGLFGVGKNYKNKNSPPSAAQPNIDDLLKKYGQ